jgi:MFS family permease
MKGPLANSYRAAVVMVVFALVPYLALTGAFTPLTPVLSKSLHLSHQALALTTGMANGAYAFGTVLAVQFAVHLPARRMLVLYAVLFVISSALAASALTPGLFIAGHVVQGLTTSLMLIAAVPPLIIGWPVPRMRFTAVIMNLCIFGAVALGPIIGGVQAAAHEWQPLFWMVTGLGAAALLLVLLTYEDAPAQDRKAPWDLVALLLAGLGCGATFFGASELTTHRLLDVIVFLPLVAGVFLLVTLVVYEAVTKRPLMPVRQLGTTLPVVGVIIAMSAGAASVAVIQLTQTALQKSTSPGHLAMLFWPEFAGAVVSAALFGALFRTRLIPVIVFAGMALISGGAAVLTGVGHGPHTLVVVGSGLLGLGVGASVSPALFIAGFSLRSGQIQRVFALVELLRGVAAFMVAPLLLHLAMTTGANPLAGGQTAMWVAFGIAAGGGLLALYVFALGRARLQRPNLEAWNGGDEPAWDSPPLGAGIRGGARRGSSEPARSLRGG